MSGAVEIIVDGRVCAAEAGATILEVCDAAGLYIPRLCYYPALGCAGCTARGEPAALECRLCVVELGDGSIVPACATPASAGLRLATDTARLRALRLERLAAILDRHPHVCLTCPDAEGCNRDQCTYGNPPETRCCAEYGRCEVGRLIAWLDANVELPRRAIAVARDASTEGRIRYEAGLCIGCGRCVRACATLPEAGDALELAPAESGRRGVEGVVARPRRGTLRASGCTFCGQCVLVCPAGALTAPGEKGATWIKGRRGRSGLPSPVLPPSGDDGRLPFDRPSVEAGPRQAGVFVLLDRGGRTLLIRGVANLREGLEQVLHQGECPAAALFEVHLDELYTQRESELLARHAREHGGLPTANDLDDDLF